MDSTDAYKFAILSLPTDISDEHNEIQEVIRLLGSALECLNQPKATSAPANYTRIVLDKVDRWELSDSCRESLQQMRELQGLLLNIVPPPEPYGYPPGPREGCTGHALDTFVQTFAYTSSTSHILAEFTKQLVTIIYHCQSHGRRLRAMSMPCEQFWSRPMDGASVSDGANQGITPQICE